MRKNIDTSVLKLNFNPTEIEVIDIKSWLQFEDKKSGEGFYCNWNIIESSFRKGQLVTIIYFGTPIGFLTWNKTSDLTAKIEITEINPSYRKKGVGKILIEGFIVFLLTKNVQVLTLECSPLSSRPIWKKLGFSEYNNFDSQLVKYESFYLYKIIVPHVQKNISAITPYVFIMWNCLPEDVGQKPPFAIWHFEYEKNTHKLRLPIIHPAHEDWALQLSIGNNIIKHGKIKSFTDEVFKDGFLIINSIMHSNNY